MGWKFHEKCPHLSIKFGEEGAEPKPASSWDRVDIIGAGGVEASNLEISGMFKYFSGQVLEWRRSLQMSLMSDFMDNT